MKRKYLNIDFMPNYPDWEQVIEYFMRKYKCTREEVIVKADRERYLGQIRDNRARIVYCEKNQCWKGRKTKALKIGGKGRPGDDPNCLRNTLNREIGEAYLSTPQVKELLVRLYGEQAESKLTQARVGKMIVRSKTFGVWYLPATDPPTSVTDTMNRSARRVHYIGLYGDMPRLSHSPGKEFVREDSRVFQYILEKNGRPGDWEFAKAEFNRIRQLRSKKNGKNAILPFDQATREFLGCLTHRAEQPTPVALTAPVASPIPEEAPIQAATERPQHPIRNKRPDKRRPASKVVNPEDRILVERVDRDGGPTYWLGDVNVTDTYFQIDSLFIPDSTPDELKLLLIEGIGQGPFNVDSMIAIMWSDGRGELSKTEKGFRGCEWRPDEPKDKPATTPAPAPVAETPAADIESESVKLKDLEPTKDITKVVSFISRSNSDLAWVDVWQDAKQKGYAFTTSEGEYYGANYEATAQHEPAESVQATKSKVPGYTFRNTPQPAESEESPESDREEAA